MTVSPKTAGAAATVIGGSAATGVGIHQLTKEPSDKTTLGEKVKDYAIEKDGDFSYRITNKGSKDLPESVTDSNSLKTGCSNKYETLIGGLSDTELEKLVNSVNEGCTFTIKQKLEKALKTETANGQDDSTDGKIKVKNLKDYEKPATGAEFELTEIENTKKEISSSTDNNVGQKLRDGCKDAHTKSYLGNNNLGKLVNKFCTKATIKDALHGTELLVNEDLKTEGDSKVTKAKETSSGLKDPSIKDSIDNKKLQEGCKKQYKKEHDIKEAGGTEITVLAEVKKGCVLTIKEKLEETKGSKNNKSYISTADIETDSKGTSNFTSLQSHAESDTVKLNASLRTAKTTTDKGGEKLKDGCKETYEKGYKGANNNDGQLADKYCRQNP